jgi:hypothetical protein
MVFSSHEFIFDLPLTEPAGRLGSPIAPSSEYAVRLL